jgi:hypothetical protein
MDLFTLHQLKPATWLTAMKDLISILFQHAMALEEQELLTVYLSSKGLLTTSSIKATVPRLFLHESDHTSVTSNDMGWQSFESAERPA